MGQFLRAELAAGRPCLPAGDHIFRAFSRPLADVRVLIVGKTPTRRQDTRSGSRSQSPPTSGRCPDRCATSTRSSPSTSVSRRPVTGTSPPRLTRASCCSIGCSRSAPAKRPPSGAAAGRRSRRAPSTRCYAVAAPWRRSCGAATSSRSSRRSARSRGSSRPTRRPCRRLAAVQPRRPIARGPGRATGRLVDSLTGIRTTPTRPRGPCPNDAGRTQPLPRADAPATENPSRRRGRVPAG